ncbi:MAG TPA: DUF418 domain-containing protein [Methylibium sp.]|uniref:DUF418 domain-containing protein n=1 Tax=Methylibium sp. TaxID=2067992 RepID=UPI002DB76051|nr:DUF418 domain-containing protein [Methylibium sp.]HEU4458357.1 DUF418 domain-containing protein [Methylibium sp.]
MIDALRVAALAPVFVVNLGSYSTAFASGPLVPPFPADDPLAQAAAFIVAALFQAKGYPLLAFVFGYSFALARTSRGHGAAERADALAHRRRRMLRLLGIGVVHGLFVYWGDVLTIYAVGGLLLLACSRWRLRSLRRLLIGLAALALLLLVVLMSLGPMPPAAAPAPADRLQAVLHNAGYYGLSLVNAVFYLPQTLALMLAGFVAGRLRLLRHRRWRPSLARVAAWALPLGLLGNLCWAAAVHVPAGSAPRSGFDAAPLVDVLGPLLLVGLVARAAIRWQAGRARLLAALAPAGPLALSIYLASSLVGALLLGNVGLGLRPPTGLLLVGALAAWAALVAFARAAARRGERWPLESWLARA